MAQSNYVMAIDIGTTKIAAIVGKVTANGKVLIEAEHCITSQGVRRGMVENIEETVYSIKECLDGLYKKTDIRLRDVVVGIAGHHISSQQRSIPTNMRSNPNEVITEEEVEELQQHAHKIALNSGQKILQILPQDYTIDGHVVKKAVGCTGSSLTGNFHIVVGEGSSIDKIKRCIKDCGLVRNKLLLEPLASADAVLTNEEREDGVVLLDIGGGTSDMVIIHENVVRGSAIIPCGGEVITNDIHEVCGFPRRRAEYIKCEFGSCLRDGTSENKKFAFNNDIVGGAPRTISEHTLAGIIQDRVEQIIEAVNWKIMESNYGDKISSIVLTGGGALIRDLPQLMHLRTGLMTRVAYPIVQIMADKEAKELSPMMATGVGLMMSGYEEKVTTGMEWTRTLLNLSFGRKIAKAMKRIDILFSEKDEYFIPNV